MLSPSDPIRRLTLLRRSIGAAGVIGVIAALAWAVWPLPDPKVIGPSSEQKPDAPVQEPLARTGLPVGVFDRTLWHEPPAPVVVTPPKPPEMPRLELVGIRAGAGGLQAMVYDPATEELRTLNAGDAIGVTRILVVEADMVTCEAHGQRFELRLNGLDP